MPSYPTTIPDLVSLVVQGMPIENMSTIADEVVAVMNTLGTNPQGAGGTVANRIGLIEVSASITNDNTNRSFDATAVLVSGTLTFNITAASKAILIGMARCTNANTTLTHVNLDLRVDNVTTSILPGESYINSENRANVGYVLAGLWQYTGTTPGTHTAALWISRPTGDVLQTCNGAMLVAIVLN